MGGGKNFADNFSLMFEAKSDYGEASFELVSEGNHTASDGKFTDETTFEMQEDGWTLIGITSEVAFAPKEKDNNFSWILEVEDMMELEADGQLVTSGNNVSLNLEELSMKMEGTKVGAVELMYEIGSYSGKIKEKNTTMLSDFDEDSFIDECEEITGAVEDWGEDIMDLLEDELSDDVLEELYWLFY